MRRLHLPYFPHSKRISFPPFLRRARQFNNWNIIRKSNSAPACNFRSRFTIARQFALSLSLSLFYPRSNSRPSVKKSKLTRVQYSVSAHPADDGKKRRGEEREKALGAYIIRGAKQSARRDLWTRGCGRALKLRSIEAALPPPEAPARMYYESELDARTQLWEFPPLYMYVGISRFFAGFLRFRESASSFFLVTLFREWVVGIRGDLLKMSFFGCGRGCGLDFFIRVLVIFRSF